MKVLQNALEGNIKLTPKELFSHSENLDYSKFSNENYKYSQKTRIINELKAIDYSGEFGKYFVSPQGLTVPDLENDLNKMIKCSSNTIIQYNSVDLTQYKTVFSNGCGLNYCPICAKKRRSRIMADVFPVIKKLESNKNIKWYMVTISEENTKDLRGSFESLRSSWERFCKKGQKDRKGEMSKIAGFISCMEYTQSVNKTGEKTYNVHAHILVTSLINENLDYRIYDDLYKREKQYYPDGQVPKERLRQFSLALMIEKPIKCLTCPFNGSCFEKKGGVDPWANIDEKREKAFSCDNLKPVSKLSFEWIESTGGKGKNIHVDLLKHRGYVKRKNGSFKKINNMGDNVSEVIKYITKVTDYTGIDLVRNYVKLKGLKLLSRGGIFTNYEKGLSLLSDMSNHLSDTQKERIEKNGVVDPKPEQEQIIMQTLRIAGSKIVIPNQVRYSDFVVAHEKEKELYVLQGKAIAKTKKEIKEEFEELKKHWERIDKEDCGDNAERFYYNKVFIDRKLELRTELSGKLAYLIASFRKYAFKGKSDWYNVDYDIDDPESMECQKPFNYDEWLNGIVF